MCSFCAFPALSLPSSSLLSFLSPLPSNNRAGLFAQSTGAPATQPGTNPTTRDMDEHGISGAQRSRFNIAMKTYFHEEKIEALFFLAVGIGAIAFAAWALLGNDRLFKGMAYPLIAIALIQLVVGGTVFFRTDAQLDELTVLFYKHAPSFVKQELPRMEVVNFWFDVYRWIEIALIIAGAGVMLFARKGARRLLMGVGLGLVLQSTFMLALDFVAEARADVYTHEIKIIKQVVDANADDGKEK